MIGSHTIGLNRLRGQSPRLKIDPPPSIDVVVVAHRFDEPSLELVQ
jgi:hypothetical protein